MEEVNRSYARMVDLLKTTGRHLAELVGAESARVTPSDSSAIALGTAACMTGMDGAAWERLPDTTGLTKAEVVDKNGTNADQLWMDERLLEEPVNCAAVRFTSSGRSAQQVSDALAVGDPSIATSSTGRKRRLASACGRSEANKTGGSINAAY